MSKFTNKFVKMMLPVTFVFIAIAVIVNVFTLKKELSNGEGQSRYYKISINRVKQDISRYYDAFNKAPQDLDELVAFCDVSYKQITKISVTDGDIKVEELEKFINNDTEDFELFVHENNYYKIFYVQDNGNNMETIFIVNIVLVAGYLIVLACMYHVYRRIIKPFNKFVDLPLELSKGNLTMPLEENKDKMFGKFIWGMNLLREKLESNKRREMELIKERKLLLLSLSHDIKTPLSTIKLYSKAISRNLYKEEEKRIQAIESIDAKATEIEKYVAEIVKASNDEFMEFDVECEDIYVSDVLEEIREHYAEKLSVLQIDFSISKYKNCLVHADRNRLIEVLQNIIENAIKYGDGRRISIDTSIEDDEYILSIKNTGCTLQESELIHIFDSFYRGTNVNNNEGSGLGLYICRKLVHLMEGEMVARINATENESIMEVCIGVKM